MHHTPIMKTNELNKSVIMIIANELDYVSDSIQIKSILKRITGDVSAVSFDAGTMWKEKTSPFDTYIQVIDGSAEIRIADKAHYLHTGQSIVLPAHAPNAFKANERFKMISTTIKSGYEEVVF